MRSIRSNFINWGILIFTNDTDGEPQHEKVLSWGMGGERTINSLLSKDAVTLEHHPVVIIHGVPLLNRLCQKYPHQPEGNSTYDLSLLPPSEKSNV